MSTGSVYLWALYVRLVLGGKGRWGNVLLWGGGRGGGWPPRHVPSSPLRRKVLAQGGSLLVSVYLALVVLATCSAGPYPSSFMMFAGLMPLVGAAVADHARSVHRQTKGSRPVLVPLRTHPRSWGEDHASVWLLWCVVWVDLSWGSHGGERSIWRHNPHLRHISIVGGNQNGDTTPAFSSVPIMGRDQDATSPQVWDFSQGDRTLLH